MRDDGVGYSDYQEQLTHLLFLKRAGKYTKPPYNRKLPIPDGITGKACYRNEALNWSLRGTDLKGKIYEGLLEKNAEEKENLVYVVMTQIQQIPVFNYCSIPPFSYIQSFTDSLPHSSPAL